MQRTSFFGQIFATFYKKKKLSSCNGQSFTAFNLQQLLLNNGRKEMGYPHSVLTKKPMKRFPAKGFLKLDGYAPAENKDVEEMLHRGGPEGAYVCSMQV